MARLRISNVRVGTLRLSEATQQLTSSLPVCQDADYIILVGRYTSASIVNRYGLEGPGIESRGGAVSRIRPHQRWGRPISCAVATGSFPGVKQLGHGVDQPLPRQSTTEVKERVELYF
jgi:hypothetical protein